MTFRFPTWRGLTMHQAIDEAKREHRAFSPYCFKCAADRNNIWADAQCWECGRWRS